MTDPTPPAADAPSGWHITCTTCGWQATPTHTEHLAYVLTGCPRCQTSRV